MRMRAASAVITVKQCILFVGFGLFVMAASGAPARAADGTVQSNPNVLLFVKVFFVLLPILWGWYIWERIQTGEFRTKLGIIDRNKHPVSYYMFIFFSLLMLCACIIVAIAFLAS